MEREVSLPHSKMPATYPYPEPARSSPYPTSYFLKIHLNIILPSMPQSPKWSLSLRYTTKTLNKPFLSPIRATCPAHLILPAFIARKILGEEYRSLSFSLCSFLHSPVTWSLLDPNTVLSTLFSNTLSLRSSLRTRYQNPVWTILLLHTHHLSHLSNLSWFDHPNNNIKMQK